MLWYSIAPERLGALRLTIGGHLDVSSVFGLEPMLDGIIAHEPWQTYLELSRLELIDSGGLGALVGFCKRLKARGCLVTIAGLRNQPLEIFRSLGLDRRLGWTAPD